MYEADAESLTGRSASPSAHTASGSAGFRPVPPLRTPGEEEAEQLALLAAMDESSDEEEAADGYSSPGPGGGRAVLEQSKLMERWVPYKQVCAPGVTSRLGASGGEQNSGRCSAGCPEAQGGLLGVDGPSFRCSAAGVAPQVNGLSVYYHKHSHDSEEQGGGEYMVSAVRARARLPLDKGRRRPLGALPVSLWVGRLWAFCASAASKQACWVLAACLLRACTCRWCTAAPSACWTS